MLQALQTTQFILHQTKYICFLTFLISNKTHIPYGRYLDNHEVAKCESDSTPITWANTAKTYLELLPSSSMYFTKRKHIKTMKNPYSFTKKVILILKIFNFLYFSLSLFFPFLL